MKAVVCDCSIIKYKYQHIINITRGSSFRHIQIREQRAVLHSFSNKNIYQQSSSVSLPTPSDLYSLSWRISTGSSPRGFWMGVMRFCFW